MVFLKVIFNFTKRTQKVSLLFQTLPIFWIASKLISAYLFQQMQVINITLIKRNTCIIHWHIFSLFQSTLLTTKNQHNYQIITLICRKNKPNKILSKNLTTIHLKSRLRFLFQIFSSKIYTDFQNKEWNGNMKWWIVNGQRCG